MLTNQPKGNTMQDNGWTIEADDEIIRTKVDYGSPGGYLLTVARQDRIDRGIESPRAVMFVDATPVAVMHECDYNNHRVEELDTEQITRKGIQVEPVIQVALSTFGTLWNAACES